MSERKLFTPKRVAAATAVAVIFVAGNIARNNSEPEALPEPHGDNPSASSSGPTHMLKRGVTLMNDPRDPQSICGTTKSELLVRIENETTTVSQRWIQVAPVMGVIAVNQAPADEACIPTPWTNVRSIKQ